MKLEITFFAIICLMLSACSSDSETHIVNFSEAEENIVLSDVSDRWTLIPLQAEFKLDFIKNVIIKDQKIFVQERSRVICFDISGNFLWKLDSLGNGPGEYNSIATICPKREGLIVFGGSDKDPFSIYQYDQESNHFNHTAHNADEFVFGSSMMNFENGNMVLFNEENREYAPYSLYVLNKDFSVVSKLLPQTFSELANVAYPLSPFSYVGNEIMYHHYLTDSVFALSQEGQIENKYFLDFGDRAFSQLFKRLDGKIESHGQFDALIEEQFILPISFLANTEFIGVSYLDGRDWKYGITSLKSNKLVLSDKLDNDLFDSSIDFRLLSASPSGDFYGLIESSNALTIMSDQLISDNPDIDFEALRSGDDLSILVAFNPNF